MKIKEEELKLIKEQQKNLSKLVNEIGLVETQKHGLLHEIAVVNKDIRDYKEVLEAEYGSINIDLETGEYTNVEKDVEDKKD
jgi:hypothetical protein|tara:strand:+ start:4216 stop:4461 length:246 start_codon:yes stop_codon:yes gene_type:complete